MNTSVVAIAERCWRLSVPKRMTFGPFSSAGSAIGVLICDNQTVGQHELSIPAKFDADMPAVEAELNTAVRRV